MGLSQKAIKITTIAFLGIAGTAFASKPKPCAQQAQLLDKALNAVDWSRPAALETLEDVAEGKPDDTIAATARRAGLDIFTRSALSFQYACARAYAMDRIGASGLPEAIEYLKSMTVARIGPDSTETIYPASQVALYKALLRQENDPARQVAFLERQLIEPTHGAVAGWAMNELCDRGSTSSLPEIRKLIKASWHDMFADDQIRFCEARIEIVNRGPDRAKALASALSVDETLRDKHLQITRWAMAQLSGMQSSEADDTLLHYAAEIERRVPRLVPGSPAATSTAQDQILRGLEEEIRDLLAARQPHK